MRFLSLVVLAVVLGGCGSSEGGMGTSSGNTGGNGGSNAIGPDGGGAPNIGPPPTPTKLAEDVVAISGITSDDQVIYRDSEALKAIRLDGSESSPRKISEKGGQVQIRGKAVFLFADVDWTTNIGELTVWTAAGGAHVVGTALYGDDTAHANDSGETIAFMNNITATTIDLVVARSDLSAQKVVIPGVGRGSQDTCRAACGFVGSRLFVASCKPGTTKAQLSRFEAPEFGAATELAVDVNTLWSTDREGKRLFYTDQSSGAWFQENGQSVKIDTGVGWGTMLPDGSGVLYTVSDQLRRSPLPDIAATPIVATKYAARAAFSPSMKHSLYSTVVTYEGGTHRDLRLTNTDTFNATPLILEPEPIADVSRSAFTRDGGWVLYLVDAADQTKTLKVHSVEGGLVLDHTNVDTLVAAHGSRVVISMNRSDPTKYPILADLAVIDPALPTQMVTLQTGTTDGRGYYVSEDGKKVAYVMPAETGKPSAAWTMDIP